MSERDCRHGNQGRACPVCELEGLLAAEKASHAETWKMLVKTIEQRDEFERRLKNCIGALLGLVMSDAGEEKKETRTNTDEHGPARTGADVEVGHGG